MRSSGVDATRKGSDRVRRNGSVHRSLPEPKRRGGCEARSHMVAMVFMSCLAYRHGWPAGCAGEVLANIVRIFKYMQIGICFSSRQKALSLGSDVPRGKRERNPGGWHLPSGLTGAAGNRQRDLGLIRWGESFQQFLLGGCGQSARALWPSAVCRIRERFYPLCQGGLACRV